MVVGVGEEGGGVEFTQALPSQYWPDEQVVEGDDCGELQHPALYQYQPEDEHIDESKQVLGVLQLEVVVVLPQSLGHEPELSPDSHILLLLHAVVVVVEVTQAFPSQYWPDEQEVEEGLITQAVPLQYCPDGQVVVVVVDVVPVCC